MAAYVDILEDFLEAPPQAAEAVGRERPLGLGLWCFLFSGSSLFLAESVAGRLSWVALGPVTLVFFCLWRVLKGFLWAAVLHLMMDFGRSRRAADAAPGGDAPSAAGLFVLLGLSDLSWTLALPAVLVLRFLSWDRAPAFMALFAALWLANLALKARSVKDHYRVSSAAAWTALVIPYAAAALIFIALFSALVALAAVSLMHQLS